MTADELLELLKERPFKPLRLHPSDGQVREIPQPNVALVAADTVLVGAPGFAHRGAEVFVLRFGIESAERFKHNDDPNYLAEKLAWL